jgi:hypothetical protein
MHTLKCPTNTFFSWPKAAVTFATLPEQTHNNSAERIAENVMPNNLTILSSITVNLPNIKSFLLTN